MRPGGRSEPQRATLRDASVQRTWRRLGRTPHAAAACAPAGVIGAREPLAMRAQSWHDALLGTVPDLEGHSGTYIDSSRALRCLD
jgi:hypothetical protein